MSLVISDHTPMEQADYIRFIQDLLPHEVACIPCAHPVTHEHGAYERTPLYKGGQSGSCGLSIVDFAPLIRVPLPYILAV